MWPSGLLSVDVEACMLEAVPQRLFSWDFAITQNARPIAVIDMSWFRERAEVRVGNKVFEVRRDSLVHGTFALHGGDELLATAQKESALVRAFRVDVAGRLLDLKAVSFWRRDFELVDHGALIGRVSSSSWLGRGAKIDFPDDLSIPVQVFMFWLVVVIWRRAAAAAAS
jgi:hypothetical protein